MKYQGGSVVRVPSVQDDWDFSFIQIASILVVNDTKFFVGKHVTTKEFNPHYFAYEVQVQDRTSLFRYSDFVQHDALNIKMVGNKAFVNEKYAVEFHVPGLY